MLTKINKKLKKSSRFNDSKLDFNNQLLRLINKKFVFLMIIVVLVGLLNVYSLEVKIGEKIQEFNDKIDNKYELDENQEIEIIYGTETDKKSVKFSSLKRLDEDKASITVDKDGKISKANFKTGKEGDYLLGNELVKIPKDAEVRFNENKANIKLPDNYELSQDIIEPVNKNEERKVVFEFTNNKNQFSFKDKGILKVDNGKGLKFENGNYFIDYEGKAELNSLNIINGKTKTYIDFKGEVGNYKGAYISMDEKKGVFVTGSNIDEFGPKISFDKNNPYDLRINDNDHMAVQSLGNENGNYIKIMNRKNDGKVPLMETLNEFGINFDKKTIHYNSVSEKLYFSPKVLIGGFETKESSVPIEIQGFKKKNGGKEAVFRNKEGKINVVGIADEAEWGYGSNPSFIKTTTGYRAPYTSLKRGFSNAWFYYNIKTVQDMERFLGNKIKIYDNARLLNNQKDVKWVTDLLAGLPKGVRNSVKNIYFQNSISYGGGYVGGLSGGSTAQIARSNFDPETIRHEISHLYHFTDRGAFTREWESIRVNPTGQLSTGSGASNGFAYGYGSSNVMEDVATYGDKIYSPNYWTNLVKNNPYESVYRGKLAVLYKHGFISQNEYSSIMKRAGIDSSTSSIQKYITEAQAFVRNR